jgi:hypothetical protein
VSGTERKFSAYGITQDDDPVSQALRGLIDNAAGQEHQIAMIWKALEQLCAQQQLAMPGDAAKTRDLRGGQVQPACWTSNAASRSLRCDDLVGRCVFK